MRAILIPLEDLQTVFNILQEKQAQFQGKHISFVISFQYRDL